MDVICGSGLQKHVERFHAKWGTSACMEDNRMMKGTEPIRGPISGEALILDDWDKWESNEIEEKHTMDENKNLIQKRSIQNCWKDRGIDQSQRCHGCHRGGKNSTIGKDIARNEDDGLILEEVEIVENKGKDKEESKDLCIMGALVKSTGGKNRPVDSKDRKNKYWSKKETTIMKKDNTERGGGSSVRG